MSDQGDGAGSPVSRLGSSPEGSSEYPTDPLPKVTDEAPPRLSDVFDQPPFDAAGQPSFVELSFGDPEPPPNYKDEDFDVFAPYSERSQPQQAEPPPAADRYAEPDPYGPADLDPPYQPPGSEAPDTYGAEPNAYRSDQDAYRPEPDAYGAEPAAYHPEPDAYRSEPDTYRADREAYGAEPDAYRTEPPAYQPLGSEAYDPDQEAYQPLGTTAPRQESASEWSERVWSQSPLDAPLDPPLADAQAEEPSPAAPEHGDEWVFAQHGSDEPPVEMPPPPPADRLPGKPSSGNMKMPDWMREENNDGFGDSEDGHKSRVLLIVGLVILVVILVAAAGVVLFRHHGSGTKAAITQPSTPTSVPASRPSRPAKSGPPQKPLQQFAGAHTAVAGRVTDDTAGLSYTRFGKPWVMPPQKNSMTEPGFSTGQYVVTEKNGSAPIWWGRLLSTMMSSADKGLYGGPGTERRAAQQLAAVYQTRLYGFRHQSHQVASQALTVNGHRGWLVGYDLTYHRPKVKATGEIFTLAVVDTGKARPGVLVMSIPNTQRKLWPDINFVLHSLKVV